MRSAAFTRRDLLATICVVLVLAFFFWSRWRRTQYRRSASECRQQLKQVWIQYAVFYTDNGDKGPTQISTNQQGTLEYALNPGLAYMHFRQLFSEYEPTIQILSCPTDAKKSVRTFKEFSNANLSYFISVSAHPPDSNWVLSGDRNLTGASNVMFDPYKAESIKWHPEMGLHGDSGYVAYFNGQVDLTSSIGLAKAFGKASGTNLIAIP